MTALRIELSWPAAELSPNASKHWTEDELALVRAAYENAVVSEDIDLDGLACKLGRHKTNISRKARQLGLTNISRKLKRERKPHYKVGRKGSPELHEHMSKCAKDRIVSNGHPRGMLGKKHKAEVRRQIGEKSAAFWAALTAEQRQEVQDKMQRASRAAGPPKTARGTWKADWRTIGGRRNYYRSRWEANYARWLQWLKERGDIIDWEHEPKVFWFEKILRGVRSYKPDFCVQDREGEITWHEVKGWMDARSVTTLKRFAKYYPDEILILIREPQIRTLGKNHAAHIEGWEA